MRQLNVLGVKVIALVLMVVSVQANAQSKRRSAVKMYGESINLSQNSEKRYARRASRAEGSTRTVVDRNDSEDNAEVKRFRVGIDAAPLVLGGVGGFVEYSILDRLTIGPSVSYFNMKAETPDPKLNMRHTVTQYSLRARYFLFGNSDRTAAYVMAGGTFVTLDTEAEFSNTMPGKARKSMTDFGPVGGIGFQFAGVNMGPTRLVLNVGALYGHGNEVSARAQNNPWHGSQLLDQTISSNFYFETGIGLLF